jgi:hypothetical protein
MADDELEIELSDNDEPETVAGAPSAAATAHHAMVESADSGAAAGGEGLGSPIESDSDALDIDLSDNETGPAAETAREMPASSLPAIPNMAVLLTIPNKGGLGMIPRKAAAEAPGGHVKIDVDDLPPQTRSPRSCLSPRRCVSILPMTTLRSPPLPGWRRGALSGAASSIRRRFLIMTV